MGLNALNAGTIAAVITLDNSRFTAGVNGSIASLAKFADKSNSTGQRITHLGSAMSSLGVAMTKTVSVPIAAAMIASAVAAIRFETAMTGVAKTANLSDSQLEKLSGEIMDLSKTIPVTTTELAGIAEVAGQLGIKTENLASFTETMAMMATATNMTAEEAATQLARFANITSMAQTDFDRLGSVVVELGNNFATTEAEIAEAGQRLAGAGKLVRMSEAEIMGLAAAYTSLGINVEAGGTAISRVLRDIETHVQTGGDKLAKFAEVSGMSAEQFQAAWRENSADTFNSVIKGLNGIYRSGGNVIQTLRDMGVTEIRVTDAMSRLATSGTVLGDALTHARTAWEDNNALLTEAERRYATTESQLTLLGNQATVVGIQFGNMMLPAIQSIVGAFRDFLNWVENLSPGVKSLIGDIALIGFTAGPVIAIFGRMATVIGHSMMAAELAAGGARLLSLNYSNLEKVIAAFIVRSKAAKTAKLADAAATAAGATATAADAAATTANTAATTANTAANAGNAVSNEASAVAEAADAAATTADTTAKAANTVATEAGTVANKAFIATLMTNPLTWVIAAAATIGTLIFAIKSASNAGEQLTSTSQRQKKEMEEAQHVYEKSIELYGETSVQAQNNKKALDDATEAYERNKLTVDEWNDKIEESKQRSADLGTTISGMNDSFNGEAGNIRALVEEFNVLNNTENRSAEQKTRLAQVTYELNNSVQGCNLQYSALNDTVSGSVDILGKLATLEIERRQGELAAEKMNILYDEQAVLMGELEQATTQQTDAQKAYDEALKASNDTASITEVRFGRTNSALTEAQRNLNSATGEVERLTAELDKNKAELQENLDAMTAYVSKQTAIEAAAKLCSQAGYDQEAAIKKVNEAYETNIEAADLEAYATEKAAAALQAASEEVLELMGNMPGLESALTSMGYSAETFGQLLIDAGMDAETFGGIVQTQMEEAGNAVEAFDSSSHTSLADFKQNLADRTAAQETWSTSYKTIMERTGLDGNSAFIQYIGSLPLEQAGLLEEMANDPNLTDLATKYDESMGNVYTNSVKWLEQLGTEGKEAAKAIGEGVNQGVTEGQEATAQAIIENGRVSMDNLIETMREASGVHSPSTKTIPIGQGLMEGVKVGMEENSSMLTETISTVMNSAITGMSSTSGQWNGIGAMIMTSIASGITSNASSVTSSMQMLASLSVMMMSMTLTMGMGNAARSAMNAFNAAFSAGMATWRATAMAMVASACTSIGSTMYTGMSAAGKRGAQGILAGFKSGMSGAASSMSASVSSAAASVGTSAYSSMYSAGQSAGQGFLDGLTSKESSILNKADSIATKVANKIEKALDINSPSKVTRELGMFAGMGLWLGLDDEAEHVENAAARLAKAAIPDQSVINAATAAPKLDVADMSFNREAIDYDRLGVAVARAMGGNQSIGSLVNEVKTFGDGVVNAISNMGINMDGKKVGDVVSDRVDRNIGRKARVRGGGL